MITPDIITENRCFPGKQLLTRSTLKFIPLRTPIEEPLGILRIFPEAVMMLGVQSGIFGHNSIIKRLSFILLERFVE